MATITLMGSRSLTESYQPAIRHLLIGLARTGRDFLLSDDQGAGDLLLQECAALHRPTTVLAIAGEDGRGQWTGSCHHAYLQPAHPQWTVEWNTGGKCLCDACRSGGYHDPLTRKRLPACPRLRRRILWRDARIATRPATGGNGSGVILFADRPHSPRLHHIASRAVSCHLPVCIYCCGDFRPEDLPEPGDGYWRTLDATTNSPTAGIWFPTGFRPASPRQPSLDSAIHRQTCSERRIP